jgi:hypothetical protein
MYAINLAIKIAFFAVFIYLIYFVLDYFLNLVVNNLNIPFLSLFSYLGVLQAIQILVSMAIASYVINQVISYFRN